MKKEKWIKMSLLVLRLLCWIGFGVFCNWAIIVNSIRLLVVALFFLWLYFEIRLFDIERDQLEGFKILFDLESFNNYSNEVLYDLVKKLIEGISH